MIRLDDALADEYLDECREHLATMETDLVAMETGGVETYKERIERAYRSAHLITGGAKFFELVKIGELAGRTEEVLALMRGRELRPTPDRIGVLLRATDKLRELIQNAAESNWVDISRIMIALDGLCAGQLSPVKKAPVSAVDRPLQEGGHLRILLVEDDFASRLVLQTFLSRYGECHIAVNGREAVEAFRVAAERDQRYDLICMDIMMPEMDGREAVRQVRAQEVEAGIISTYGAKIIMTTTVDDVKEVIRCFQELCDAYLMKPIDLGELLRQLRICNLVQ